MSSTWEAECRALRHANRLLLEGHEEANRASYERGRLDMMREIKAKLESVSVQVYDEVAEFIWPEDSR